MMNMQITNQPQKKYQSSQFLTEFNGVTTSEIKKSTSFPKEAFIDISINKNFYRQPNVNYIVFDKPNTNNDLFLFCTKKGCQNIPKEDALGADSVPVERVFGKTANKKAIDSFQEDGLRLQKDILARQFSKQNILGDPIDENSLPLPGVLHTFETVSSTFSTDETVSFLVGNTELSPYENLPYSISNDNMIKVAIAQKETLYPALVYLDLESNQNLTLYRTSFYKGTPSWKSITLGDYEYLDYLMKMIESLEKVYSGDAATNGKIQAYEAIEYIKNILTNSTNP